MTTPSKVVRNHAVHDADGLALSEDLRKQINSVWTHVFAESLGIKTA